MPDDRDRSPQFSFGVEPNANAPVVKRSARRRWLVALAVALVLLGSVGGYVYVFQPHLLQRALGHQPFLLPSTTTHAYKWQDEDGAWHITDEPPTEGIPYEKLTVRSDTNVVPATPGRDEN
jgi:hypothetical protein